MQLRHFGFLRGILHLLDFIFAKATQNSGSGQNSLIFAQAAQNCVFFGQNGFILAKAAQNSGLGQNSFISATAAQNWSKQVKIINQSEWGK